jgi:predicted NACHT family NTPase
MAKRSLQASTAGIAKAKLAFDRKGWTQEYLAAEVGLETRQSIWKFFKGKAIEKTIFIDICFKLDLDWQEVADLPSKIPGVISTNSLEISEDNLDSLLSQARETLKAPMIAKWGNLRLVDSSQFISLNELYVPINFLEQMSRQRWLEVEDLQAALSPNCPNLLNQSGRLTGEVLPTVPALQAITTHSQLMILGKPGAGKTTLLKSVAIQCLEGKIESARIPVFIQLKSWAEKANYQENYSIVSYLIDKLSDLGISAQLTETFLKKGKLLILLDGFDEISEKHSTVLIHQISSITEKFYQNKYIITGRFATKHYQFSDFTEVEIADFNEEQIHTFAQKWFTATTPHQLAGLDKASQFIEKLKSPENRAIRELAVTPILLTLTAGVFQTKANFPNKRSKLYEAGLDILLVQWDETRGIQRSLDIDQSLSLSHKIELLSYIAAITFEQNSYFFEQKEIEYLIIDYLEKLPEKFTTSLLQNLQALATSILKSIESQHGLFVERARGIYSFSHLTFQEYFTARYLANAGIETLQKFARYVIEPQWREVFLLTSELLRNSDEFLQAMQENIQNLVRQNQTLQNFLIWIDQKSKSMTSIYQPAAVRAFYFTLFLDRDIRLAVALDSHLARDLEPDLLLDLKLTRALFLILQVAKNPDLKQILAVSFALDLERALQTQPALFQALIKLKEKLPQPALGREPLIQWWKTHGLIWAKQFQALLIEYRNIAHNWQFSPPQQTSLEQYYRANLLLVECLNGECRCSSQMRTSIESTLLLPAS